MDQSELLGGALIGGFVLYLAMNKRLGVYWAILTGGTGKGGTASASSSSSNQGTAGTPAVGGSTPTAATIGNFLTGNWWRPAESTSQGTLTTTGSATAASQGAGIGMM